MGCMSFLCGCSGQEPAAQQGKGLVSAQCMFCSRSLLSGGPDAAPGSRPGSVKTLAHQVQQQACCSAERGRDQLRCWAIEAGVPLQQT